MKKRLFGHGWLSRLVIVFLAAGWAALASGATITWTGSLDSDWFTTNNWSPAQVPVDGDAVVINSGTPLLTNATASLQSFTMNGGTLTCSNWSTRIVATDAWVLGSAQITLPPAFTNSPAMSNRVWIACTNFFLDSGASINAKGKGYAAINTPGSTGSGPGGGAGYNAGGGYGGRGGDMLTYANYALGANQGGLPYGSLEAPEAPGSAGGNDNDYKGNHGGGAVRIESPGGNVTVNGAINANANDAPLSTYGTCNGSGGGIFITCRTFAGTNGTITADAGKNGWGGTRRGGGGRIAVVYDTSAQAALPKPSVLFSAAKGGDTSGEAATPNDIGTIYFPDSSLLNESWLPHIGQVWMTNAAWNVNSLTVNNGWIRFPADGFKLTVTNSATITGASGMLELGGANVSKAKKIGPYAYIYSDPTAPTFTVGGNLILTNGGSLIVYSAPTNGASTNYGAQVTVAGDVLVANSSWIYAHSNPTNGGAPLLRMNNLTVAGPGGGINANYRGYRNPAAEDPHGGYGPGGGSANWGGSYGGVGSGYGTPGVTYGSSNAPIDPGSSGGCGGGGIGGNGGGAIRIVADSTVTIKGALSANGQAATYYYAGGSGGGIYIRCKKFDGTAGGSLSANGGSAPTYGFGGGGRIAVWRLTDVSGGSVPASVNSGGYDGSPGTIVWGLLPPPGTVIKGY